MQGDKVAVGMKRRALCLSKVYLLGVKWLVVQSASSCSFGL